MKANEAKKLMAAKLAEAGIKDRLATKPKLIARTIRSRYDGLPRVCVHVEYWDRQYDDAPFHQFAKENGFILTTVVPMRGLK